MAASIPAGCPAQSWRVPARVLDVTADGVEDCLADDSSRDLADSYWTDPRSFDQWSAGYIGL